ncbi:PhoX family protein [Roseococcus sp. YIM B11640]|uniref:PhoX family protein n=1 Tax=Roseococcus sp. YIM B11640 TaxID=3133973 RepID=UPI003C7BE52F
MIFRRHLLATPALLLPAAALAQTAPAVKQDDWVAPDYRRDMLIRWGDRVTFDAPPFDPGQVDAEGAGAQFGWDARIAALVVPPDAADRVPRGVLAVAHPTVNAAMAFPGGVDRPDVAVNMQGASLLNVELQGGRWIVVDGGFQSRRLTAGNLCRASGPLVEQSGSALRGLLAVTGGTATPWGTLLLTEGDAAPWLSRMAGLGRPEAFGWLVELDPLDPQSIPVKHTALGRFPKADAAAAAARGGQAVVFLAEEGPAGYLYRFVSSAPASGGSALEAGSLAVAQFQGGRLNWLTIPEGGLANVSEAARQAGGTPFDAPSGLAWDPQSGRLHACGGFGVLTLTPDGGDPASNSMSGAALGTAALGRIATVAVDGRGRLLLGTDTNGVVGATAQTLWLADRGSMSPLYGVARAAGIGGAAVSPDGRVIFTVARRPGAERGASFDRPSTRWPQFEPGVPPRSALISLTR